MVAFQRALAVGPVLIYERELANALEERRDMILTLFDMTHLSYTVEHKKDPLINRSPTNRGSSPCLALSRQSIHQDDGEKMLNIFRPGPNRVHVKLVQDPAGSTKYTVNVKYNVYAMSAWEW